MANREIKIRIAADANLAALRQVNTELAKMAMDVGRKNGDLRQATMLAAREYFNLGDASEKAATRAVLSAKQIEEAWRKAMTRPTDEAGKGFGKLKAIAEGALGGIGGKLNSVFKEFGRGGIWGLAAKAFVFAWEKAMEAVSAKQREAYAKMKREAEETASALKDSLTTINETLREQYALIDRIAKRRADEVSSLRELQKAEIEHAKQIAIANGMDAASANAAAGDLSAQVDYEADAKNLRDVLELQQRRVAEAKKGEAEILANVEASTQKKAAAEAEYQKKREEYIRVHSRDYVMSPTGMGMMLQVDESESRRRAEGENFDKSDEARQLRKDLKIEELAENIKNGKKAAADAKIEASEAEAAIAKAQTALDVLATKREARELAVQNEIAAEVEADRKAQAEKDKAAAEKRAEAERKAAEKVAAERARLDAQEAARRERERQAELAARIRDHQKLLAAERAEESKTRSAVSAAESKLQQAWGWYRDKDSMAAQIAEEKADAQARKQFEKDFERLKDRRRDWRKAENLSVDDEAVRRVALAREEKETAEKHLAEIEKNTADLAAKLDELLQVKG